MNTILKFQTARVRLAFRQSQRCFSDIDVPFKDDLTKPHDDDFNLGDFQYYIESEDVTRQRALQLRSSPEPHMEYEASMAPQVSEETKSDDIKKLRKNPSNGAVDLRMLSRLKEPLVFIAESNDPYTNLAIEDYIYNNMPVEDHNNANSLTYDRLLFYINSPCVVIGKNQNPWKETNLSLLTKLQIPLLRRHSGGGTVVHDMGNINFSFMTTKNKFSRTKFAQLVVDEINKLSLNTKQLLFDVDGNPFEASGPEYKIKLNERGDIVTEDGFKLSGSAYKLSKGRSYHHGTMLLSSKLDILKQLLHRDDSKYGEIVSNSVASVKSPVKNLGMNKNLFMNSVIGGFKESYGTSTITQDESHDDNYDDGLFGLGSFGPTNNCKVIHIPGSNLPEEIYIKAKQLQSWEWKYTNTPEFRHTLTHPLHKFSVEFFVVKGYLTKYSLHSEASTFSQKKLEEHFWGLSEILKRGEKVKYIGSDVAGFILEDEISEWIGDCIDGTS